MSARRPWRRRRRSLAGSLGAALLAGLLGGCAASTPAAESAPPPEDGIASVHARKCGRCHTRPEPQTRTREHLADAFGRHQKQNRVRLTADQWSAMIDYLAVPDAPRSAQAH